LSRHAVVYTQVRDLFFLAEGLFFIVAWGKRSAALGIEISKDVWPKAKIT